MHLIANNFIWAIIAKTLFSWGDWYGVTDVTVGVHKSSLINGTDIFDAPLQKNREVYTVKKKKKKNSVTH